MPAGPSTAGNPTAPYNPGSSEYDPGNTGYSPPGVPEYQSPAPPNAVAARKDPYYRPGGTTDYVPPGQTPTATADRYNNPAEAYSQGNPYLAPDGSNSPARGYQ